jgi:hypothetical protein
VKVDGATAAFGVGGYQLTADYLTLGSLLSPVTNLLAPILDLHLNDLLSGATVLTPLPKPTPDARFDFTYRGVIEDSTDVDNYKIHSPVSSAPLNLNALVWGLDATPVNPQLHVFDAAGNPVAFQVLTDDVGMFSLQVLNVKSGADYFIQVAGRSSTGSYFLGADFNSSTPTAFDGIGAATLQPTGVSTDTLVMSQSGLFAFQLAADVVQAGGGGITMSVIDASGSTVFSLSTNAGQPPSTTFKYLAAGNYTVRYTWIATSGTTNVATKFNLSLLKLSDPVGPYATTTSSTAPSGSTSSSSSSSSPPPPSGDSGYTYTSSSTSTPNSYWYSY